MSFDKKYWDLEEIATLGPRALKLHVRGLVRMRLYEIDPSKHAPGEVVDHVAGLLLSGQCVAVGLPEAGP